MKGFSQVGQMEKEKFICEKQFLNQREIIQMKVLKNVEILEKNERERENERLKLGLDGNNLIAKLLGFKG